MITRIEALRYRCLRHICLDLDRFHVLVGPNASGKSTLLDVIAFIGDFLNEGVDAAVSGSRLVFPRVMENFSELVFDRAGKDFELALELAIPERLRKQGNGNWTRCRYQVAIGAEGQAGEIRILQESFWLKPDDKAPPTVPSLFPAPKEAPETIMAGTERTPPGWRKVVNKIEGSGNDYFRSETTDWNNAFRLGPRKAALANLPEDESKFPVATWAKRYLMEQIQTLMLSSYAMRSPAPPGRPVAYLPNGSNLPVLVQYLQQREPERFRAWVEHVRTCLTDLKEVKVIEIPHNKNLYVQLDYGHVSVPSWLVSDGTLRLLALTLLAYLPAFQRTLMIEEPENGVHPKAVEAVFQSLSSVYESQVLLASHSPLILGLAKPEQLLCFAKLPDGSADIVRGDLHPALREWSGEVDLPTLYAAGVLG